MDNTKQQYTSPEIEIVEMSVEQSIAASADGVSLWEEMWG